MTENTGTVRGFWIYIRYFASAFFILSIVISPLIVIAMPFLPAQLNLALGTVFIILLVLASFAATVKYTVGLFTGRKNVKMLLLFLLLCLPVSLFCLLALCLDWWFRLKG